MPPGRKEWFHDPSDDYVIGPGNFNENNSLLGGRTDKSNKEFWEEWSNPLHLWDYVPGTRIPKKEWSGNKFWERKPIPPYNPNRFVFPTSEGRCPLCGEFLLEKRSKYGNFYGCSAFPKCKYKCTEKQYHAIIPDTDPEELWKSLVQPIEIANTKKASEAKELALKNDNKTKKVRNKLDKVIKCHAMSGERHCEPVIYTDHDIKEVVKGLRADGYKVGFDCVYDPRDGTDTYVYRISW